MSDVKRYEAVHLRYDDNNIRYGEGCEVEVVLASDYAALEAELAKLRAVPDAITMADVMRAWEYAEDHPHKYLRGTTNWCAAVAYSLNQRNPSDPATAVSSETVQGDGWIHVSERLPESERTVLAFYLNSHGKGRRVRAEYIAAKTKSADDGWDSDEPADYDEHADEYFWPAGWYEVMDNWDDLTHMVIHEGEVTHWMPLPAAPARQEGGKV